MLCRSEKPRIIVYQQYGKVKYIYSSKRRHYRHFHNNEKWSKFLPKIVVIVNICIRYAYIFGRSIDYCGENLGTVVVYIWKLIFGFWTRCSCYCEYGLNIPIHNHACTESSSKWFQQKEITWNSIFFAFGWYIVDYVVKEGSKYNTIVSP